MEARHGIFVPQCVQIVRSVSRYGKRAWFLPVHVFRKKRFKATKFPILVRGRIPQAWKTWHLRNRCDGKNQALVD